MTDVVDFGTFLLYAGRSEFVNGILPRLLQWRGAQYLASARLQMDIGIKNFIALATPHPAIRHAKLVWHDFEHRGAYRASGNQAHRAIVDL